MFRKALFATTILVVAGTMAFAASQPVARKSINAAQAKKNAQAHMLKFLIPDGATPLFANKRDVPAGFLYNNIGKTQPRNSRQFSAGATLNTFSKSKNALFLSFYGWAAQNENVSRHSSSSSCYSSSNGHCVNRLVSKYSATTVGTHSTATPITGKGRAVTTIQLGGYGFQGYGANGKVGIYSNHYSSFGDRCTTNGGGSSSLAASCPANPIAGASGTFTVPSSTLCCAVQTVTFSPTTLSKNTRYWVVVTGASGTAPYNNYLAWDMEDSNYATAPSGFVWRYHYTNKSKVTYTTTRFHGTKYYHTSHNTGYSSSPGWLQAGGYTGYPPALFVVDAPALVVE